jgi:hypothetical protein
MAALEGVAEMPLVHRFSGPGFAPSEPPTQRLRAAPPLPPEAFVARKAEPADAGGCRLCSSRAPIFDPARRCCVDRYESQFGSVAEHRHLIADALQSAMRGDLGPARRLVESYRRVFGPMAAVELRRSLWRAIDEPRGRSPNLGFASVAAAAGVD